MGQKGEHLGRPEFSSQKTQDFPRFGLNNSGVGKKTQTKPTKTPNKPQTTPPPQKKKTTTLVFWGTTFLTSQLYIRRTELEAKATDLTQILVVRVRGPARGVHVASVGFGFVWFGFVWLRFCLALFWLVLFGFGLVFGLIWFGFGFWFDLVCFGFGLFAGAEDLKMPCVGFSEGKLRCFLKQRWHGKKKEEVF